MAKVTMEQRDDVARMKRAKEYFQVLSIAVAKTPGTHFGASCLEFGRVLSLEWARAFVVIRKLGTRCALDELLLETVGIRLVGVRESRPECGRVLPCKALLL